jgi:hypothetical protein
MALAAAVVVVVVVVAIAILYERTAPLRAAILEVDGTSITMGYFLKRASYAAAEPSVVLQTLVNEQIIEQAAPLRPYAIKVTDADVDQLLMEKARGERGTSWRRPRSRRPSSGTWRGGICCASALLLPCSRGSPR